MNTGGIATACAVLPTIITVTQPQGTILSAAVVVHDHSSLQIRRYHMSQRFVVHA